MNRELPNGNEEKKIIQTSNFNVEIIYFFHCVDASAGEQIIPGVMLQL
jgi:hypothetical protein